MSFLENEKKEEIIDEEDVEEINEIKEVLELEDDEELELDENKESLSSEEVNLDEVSSPPLLDNEIENFLNAHSQERTTENMEPSSIEEKIEEMPVEVKTNDISREELGISKKASGLGYIGKSIVNYITNSEKERMPILDQKNKVLVDLTQSEVTIILGKRGSGKSYSVRVYLEEIIKENPYVGVVVIDKMGLYFSLKYPNKNEREFQGFSDVKPIGFEKHVTVYLPASDKKKVPKGAYDNIISLRPNQVPFDAWCVIFKWELASPQARCLRRAITVAEESEIINYSIQDLINITEGLEKYQERTREAVINKLEFATDLGLFSNEGVKLSDVVQVSSVAVIDVSLSGNEVARLFTAFFAEALYQNRKYVDSMLKHKEMGEVETDIEEIDVIPPTFLVLEEFHTYLPRIKGGAVSSEGLVQYIKEGRGCGLSFIGISQEPALINITVLRQLGILIVHTLTAEEEIKSALAILPCPADNKKMKNNLKTLKPGDAFVCMRGTFEPLLTKIRPAHTIHLATSENTTIFQDTINKQMLQRSFKVFSGHVDLSHIKKMNDVNKGMVEEIKRLTRENTDLRDEILRYKDEIEESKKVYDGMVSDRSVIYKRDLEKYKLQIEALQADSDSKDLEIELLLKKDDDPKGGKFKKEISKLKDEIKELRNKNKDLEKTIKDLEKIVQVSDKEKNLLIKEKDSLQEKVERHIEKEYNISSGGTLNETDLKVLSYFKRRYPSLITIDSLVMGLQISYPLVRKSILTLIEVGKIDKLNERNYVLRGGNELE